MVRAYNFSNRSKISFNQLSNKLKHNLFAKLCVCFVNLCVIAISQSFKEYIITTLTKIK